MKFAARMTNHRLLNTLSLMSTCIFAVIVLVAVIGEDPFMKPKLTGYLIGFGSSLAAFLFNKFAIAQKPMLQNTGIAILSLGLYCYGLYLGLISSPAQLTVSLLVMFVLVPQLFIGMPIHKLSLTLLAAVPFLFAAPHCKPSAILVGDCINVAAFGIVGIVVGSFFTKTKIERLLFKDKVNQMDNKEMLNSNLKSITDLFASIHQIDLTTGYFFGLRSTPLIDRNLQSNHEDANTQFKYVMTNFANPDHLQKILDFVNLKTLPERIRGKRSICCEFLGNNLGWCRARFIAQGKISETSVPTSVIFTIQVINEEIKQRS